MPYKGYILKTGEHFPCLTHSYEGYSHTETATELADAALYTFLQESYLPCISSKRNAKLQPPVGRVKHRPAVSSRDFASHTEHKAHCCSTDLARSQSMK